MDPAPEISVVIPVYNEASNLERLMVELRAAMDAYGRSYEVITVDDGSRDGSFDVLKKLREDTPSLRVIRLARNFGQNPALYAGFEYARGQIIVTLDADLQNPPAEIPRLVEKLDEGYDIVQGVREIRQDNVFRRFASRMANRLLTLLTGTAFTDLGSSLKAYRREVVRQLTLCTHSARYLPAESARLGVSLGEVKVHHRERTAGESKYGLVSLFRINFDMIVSISSAPIHFIGLCGALFSLAGFGMGLRVAYVRLFHGDTLQLNSIFAVFFIMAGVQVICTSIMCEYISRIYTEVQRRPYYIVGEVLED